VDPDICYSSNCNTLPICGYTVNYLTFYYPTTIGRFEEGGGGPNIHYAPTSGGTLSKAHYEHMQHFTSLCGAD